MGKKILDSKLLYAVLAIVISVGLWFYVNAVENPDGDIEITRIPVTFQNQDVLEEKGLAISEGLDKTVTLKVVGSRSVLANLNKEKDKIKLTVDVGKITEPGEKSMDYTIKLPSGYENSVDVSKRGPSSIQFTVSRLVEKDFPVEVDFKATLASGYMKDEITVSPEKITVSGFENEVNSIARVVVTVTGENLTSSVEGDMTFALKGSDGEELSELGVECSVDTVKVTVPVVKTVDLPLAVKLIPCGGITDVDRYVKYSVEPKSITVSGEEKYLAGLQEIVLAEIDLALVEGDKTIEYDIVLDPELSNVSGITTATVTIDITGLQTKSVEVTDIKLENLPSGFSAVSVTKSLQVTVRGSRETVEQIRSLTAVADLSGVDHAAGRYTVPVQIELNGVKNSGVGIYKIVVDVA